MTNNSLKMSPKRKGHSEPQNFGNAQISTKQEDVKEEITEIEN